MARPNHQLEDIEQKEILPGFKVRFVHSQHMTFAFWDIDAGSELPEHSHHHEQVAIVESGEFELTIGGDTQVYSKGKVAVIPSNAPHSGRALTDCKILDVFSPVREDYQ